MSRGRLTVGYTNAVYDLSEPRTQHSGVSGRHTAYSAALRARLGRMQPLR